MQTVNFRNVQTASMAFGLLMLGLIWTILFYNIKSERQVEIESAIRETSNYALAFDENMERIILNADQRLLLLKNGYEENGKSIDMSPYKKAGSLWDPTYLLMGIADENGDWIISNQEQHVPSNLKDREHIQIHTQQDSGKIFISKPVIGRSSGKWSINMTRRINKPDGSYGGAVIVGVSPYYFTGFYSKVNLGENSSITLIGTDGIIRARQSGSNEEVGQDLNNTAIMEELAKSPVGSYITTSKIDNVKRIYSYRALDSYPFIVIVGVDEVEVLAAWQARVKVYYLAGSAVTLLILFFTIMLLRVIAQQKRGAQELVCELQERKVIQEELVIAKEVADAANLSKSAFLANMSHEIRTPIAAILGTSKIMSDMKLSQEVARCVGIIESSSSTLLVLINDILDISKIESNRFTLENTNYCLGELIKEVIDVIGVKADEKGLTIEVNVKEELLDAILLGDPHRLKQILLNLLGNSVKFTSKGSIALTVELQAKDEICFTVEDTGVGLSQETLKDLFQDFVQADSSTARKFGGSGLGLSISHRLVNLMGGVLSAKSQGLDQGSIFWFVLPLHRGKNIKGEEPYLNQQCDLSNLKPILLVEDTKVLRQLMVMQLTKKGIPHEFAKNGFEAVNLFSPDKYSIILMDCHMPVMDGYMATKSIREEERRLGASRVPIIALTADVMPGIKEKCRVSGMDDYLTKPISLEQILEVICRWTGPGGDSAILFHDEAITESVNKKMDRQKINELMALGGSEFLVEVARGYITSGEESLALMKTALEMEQLSEFKQLVHSFKGASSYIGAVKMQTLLVDMETVEDLEDSMTLLSEVEKEFIFIRGWVEDIIASL